MGSELGFLLKVLTEAKDPQYDDIAFKITEALTAENIAKTEERQN